MNSTKPLNQIAKIIAGYTFRSTLPHQPNGGFLVLQSRNILDDGTVGESGLTPIEADDYRTTAFAQKNDVVISSRGNFRAGVLHSEHQHILAASSVYLVRGRQEIILPEYLVIYLNSESVQKTLSQKGIGSSVSTILKKDLGELPIKIPDLATQTKIIRLYDTKRRLEKLINRKMCILNNTVDQVITKSLT